MLGAGVAYENAVTLRFRSPEWDFSRPGIVATARTR